MNLPNKLTLLRIILIPIFMVVLYWGFPGATYVALAIFIIASLTDHAGRQDRPEVQPGDGLRQVRRPPGGQDAGDGRHAVVRGDRARCPPGRC